jgi:hypothetical protein
MLLDSASLGISTGKEMNTIILDDEQTNEHILQISNHRSKATEVLDDSKSGMTIVHQHIQKGEITMEAAFNTSKEAQESNQNLKNEE